MAGIRFLEYGIVFIIAAFLNVALGYWINIVMFVLGFVALIVGLLELSRNRATAKS